MEHVLHRRKHFIAYVRHGQRADHVKGVAYRNKIDPSLTQLGNE
jgi:broad specificity phosphatase PhoE